MFQSGSFDEMPPEMATKFSVRASALMEMAKSPAHYESTVLFGEKEETRAMEMGTAVHSAILEPHKFTERYCEDLTKGPEWIVTVADMQAALDRVGVEYRKSDTKAKLEAMLMEHAPFEEVRLFDRVREKHLEGREVLSPAEMVACQRIVGRIQADPRLRWLLSDGVAEKQGWVYHKESDTVVTFTPDYRREFPQPFMQNDGVVIDVKKFRDVDVFRFERAIWESNLHVQAAIYRDATNVITKRKNMFLWIVANDKAPYEVAGRYAIEPMLEAGQQAYRRALLNLAKCRADGIYPMRFTQLEPVSLPEFAWNQLDYEGQG